MSSSASERSPRSARSGQMVIFMALSLTLLFSLLGLSADLGYSYYIQLEAQAAADAAAKGAAIYAKNNGYVCTTNVTCNSSYSCPTNLASAANALQAGCLYAQHNGFTNTGNQAVTMIANNTALAGGASPSLWIQANTSQTVSHLFLLLAGFGSGPVAAKAVAAVSSTPNTSCVFVLDTGNTSGALNLSGAAFLRGSGCGVYVNSSSSTAITLGGSANIYAPTIKVHGPSPGATFGGGTSPLPTITPNSAVVTDPLINVQPPTVSATCKTTNYNGSPTNPLPTYETDGVTPYPLGGVYCGGFTVGGSTTVTLTSGIYVINGGGVNIGASGKVNGTGVMFFLTGQHGQTNAPMILNGASVVTITAPAAGPYEGILFYQDRSATYTGANQIAASGGLIATGSLYFPGTSMSLSGAVGTNTIAYIVKDMTVTGSSTINQDTIGTSTGLAAHTTGLVQ